MRKTYCSAVYLLLVVTAGAVSYAPLPVPAESSLKDQLRRTDERLLEAVHRGDRALWAEITTPDFMYVEDGEITQRQKFLQGLAEDGLLALEIRSYQVTQRGDTAIVLHTDALSPRRGRDVTNARFVMTETWQRLEGVWKLRLVHVDRVRIDPPAVELSPLQRDGLAGTYESAGEQMMVLTRDGAIYARIAGKESVLLKAETPDVLFQPGIFFERFIVEMDKKGRVTGLIERSSADDRRWTHVP